MIEETVEIFPSEDRNSTIGSRTSYVDEFLHYVFSIVTK